MRHLILTTVLMLSVVSLNAATINVPAEHTTIQAGLDAAVDGDTVLVAPGVYTENIDFRGLTIALIATDGPLVTTLTPADPDTVTISMQHGGDRTSLLCGFTVTGGNIEHTMLIGFGNDPTICDNIFRDNIPSSDHSYHVIYCRNGSPLITRNLFYGNGGRCCIGLTGTSGYTWVVNNTFDQNNLYVTGGSGGWLVNNIIRDCFGSAKGKTDPETYGMYEYNCLFSSNPDLEITGLEGTTNLVADPTFVDSAAHDYTLQEHSPCINTGHPDSVYNDPDGSRNDIGAFAFKICCIGIRGNVNYDLGDEIDISDLVYLVDYMFNGGPEPPCLSESDINGAGGESPIDISDLVYLVDYMFTGGPAPVACP